MDQLREAVSKIRAGKKAEGGRLLMEILRSDPENEQAWLWLAVAVKDPEKRKKCLNRVLAINPQNQQAINLLGKLEGQKAPPPAEKPPAPSPIISETSQPADQSREKKPAFQEPKISQTGKDQKEIAFAAEDLPPSEALPEYDRTFGELAGLWTKLFKMSESFFKKEVRYANSGDTLLSVLVHTIASVFLFLITGSVQFQNIISTLQEQLVLTQPLPNLGLLFLGLLVGTVIFTPISFYLSVGIQYLGARLFGGTGTFTAHAYLRSLIQVPITILGGVISLGSLLPFTSCILGPLGLGLTIFSWIVSVRAIKVVHDMTTGRAVGAILAPPLIFMFVIGCVLIASGAMIGPALEGLVNQQMLIP